MLSRGALGLLVLALAACNFRIDPDWTPPDRRGTTDASLRDASVVRDADLEAAALAEWCRDECAADDDEECTQVSCADAAVCADGPSCDRCLACRDR